MTQSREILLAQLDQQLGRLVSNVEIAVRNNRTGPNLAAETTLAGLLNRIHGWALVNANAVEQNCPGIDLIDTGRKIAVQVTSTRTVKKVRHTLEEAAKLDVTINRLIVLIITNQAITPEMKACTDPGYTGAMEVWNIPDVSRAAGVLDTDRLADITDYLEKELGVLAAGLEEHLELPLASALQSTGFVGREEELEEIRRRFAGRDRQVILTGLGGMGKTELAVHYGLEQREQQRQVYFVRFDKSFSHTLANMAQSIRPELGEEELRLDEAILGKRVLRLLEKCGKEDLLIIDNVDSEKESLAELQKDPNYKAICGLDMRLLLTTRSNVARAIVVRPMPEEPLFGIFRNHGAELTEAEMKDLIDAVNGHTLTIDLIARTLNGGGWRTVTAGEMLTALREKTLPSQKFDEIETDYNQSGEQAQIHEHLSVVFDLSGIPDVGKKVMRCASLLPEVGMEARLFGSSLDNAEQKGLDALLKHGWLEIKNGLLTIHPVVRMVSLSKPELQGLDCGEFLDRLWAQYNKKEYHPDRYSQMAELFTMAHDHLGSPDGRWLNRSGILWNKLKLYQTLQELYAARISELENALPAKSPELATAYNYYGISMGEMGHYDAELAYGERALKIQQEVLPADAPELGYSYNNVGAAYGNLGDYRKALKYKLDAMAIFERVLDADHPDLAISYSHVGSTYGDLGEHWKALEYQQKALGIWEKVLPAEHPDVARAYNNVGGTYGDMGNHRKALEYQQKALGIWKKVLPAEHPDLATSYNNVGGTHGALGNREKELEYHKKALAIREKALPADHPDVAVSYNSVGNTYGEMGNYRKALEYKQKALEIWKKVLPAEHPDVATSYNSVGNTYGEMGNYRKALEYQQKALRIREKVLLAEHPKLATSYNNVGRTYDEIGNYRNALEYQLKALRIWEKVLPAEHPNLASSYNNVGITYGKMGNHRKALEYQLKALEIREKVLPAEHPNLASSYNSVGHTYGEMGKHREALRHQLKALEIREKVLPVEHPSLAFSYNNVGGIYLVMGDYRMALEYQQKALEIREKALPAEHPDLATACNNIAWTYYNLRELSEAARYMRRAADIYSCSDLPEDHPHRVNSIKWAAQFEEEAKKQEDAMARIQQDLLTKFQGPGPVPFTFGKK